MPRVPERVISPDDAKVPVSVVEKQVPLAVREVKQDGRLWKVITLRPSFRTAMNVSRLVWQDGPRLRGKHARAKGMPFDEREEVDIK